MRGNDFLPRTCFILNNIYFYFILNFSIFSIGRPVFKEIVSLSKISSKFFAISSNFEIINGKYPSHFSTAAGLISSVEDLAKFALMLLNNGEYNSNQIISSKIIDECTTKQSEQSDRALGWDTKSIDGY